MSRGKAIVLAAAVLICTCLGTRVEGARPNEDKVEHIYGTLPRDDTAAAAAFESMLKVLHNPRCMNCHSAGDYPRQGDDKHRHTMNVRRGVSGDGVAAVRCSTCHQDHNLPGAHMPPGAPDWRLPPADEPMVWEGLTDRQLCEVLKDSGQNGNRNIGEIVAHMSTPLVLWAWHPGDGRKPIATPEHEFLSEVKQWAAKGAGCPAK